MCIAFQGRMEAHDTYAELFGRVNTQVAYTNLVRHLARNDLFWLLLHGLRRKDIDDDFLFERCQMVQAAPDGFLDLWAREHYKSTIITFGHSIKDILNDPNVTIGIFSHTRPISKGFLRQIKIEFEGNDLLKQSFPDIIWTNCRQEAPKWSEDDGIVLKRHANPKESTVEAWGLVDGQPTSKHFQILVFDDVVTRESVTTPDQIRKVTDAWSLSLNLGVSRGGKVRYIGTRYSFSDTYRTIMKRKAATPREIPATHDGKPDGKPIFLTRSQLIQKRQSMGPYVFACQMLQNPVADSRQGFSEKWLRYYNKKPRRDMINIYITVDPAGERKKESDYTVMTVWGLGADKYYYLLDGIRDRLNLTGRTDTLFNLVRKYRPISVGYEQYGIKSDKEHIEEKMDELAYHFEIIPLNETIPKHDRIRRLIPIFEAGRVFMPKRILFTNYEGRMVDFIEELISDEFLAFPASLHHEDMLDCMCMIRSPLLGAVFPEDQEFLDNDEDDERYYNAVNYLNAVGTEEIFDPEFQKRGYAFNP